jgi:hypothetical protein
MEKLFMHFPAFQDLHFQRNGGGGASIKDGQAGSVRYEGEGRAAPE